MDDLAVSIAGKPLDHLLYHFRLPCGGFEHGHIILGGESFVILAEGLPNALWSVGGAAKLHRTDSFSAAFRYLDTDARIDLTRRYDAHCAHYGMEPTRNKRGVAHENGALESAHGPFRTLWNNEAAFVRNFATFPGYYETRDAGFRDSDGFLHIMGRKDDIINVAGHRLSIGQMEEIVAEQAGVAECAVVGTQDPVMGMVPVAFVTASAGFADDPTIADRAVNTVRAKLGGYGPEDRDRGRSTAQDAIRQDPAEPLAQDRGSPALRNSANDRRSRNRHCQAVGGA